MQKKYKRALIISIVSVIVVTLVLVLIGLAQIGLNQCALNYNTIMASYSDTTVYGSGLYWIGLTNRFIRINKNQQILTFKNLSTFTNDFYALTASLQVSLLYQFTNSSNTTSTTLDFNTVRNFYQALGDNPSDFFYPMIKNEILIMLSSHDSLYYQNTNLASSLLEITIQLQVQSVIATWINCTIKVIIQTLVCEGTSTNTQILDRQIQSLVHDVQRISNEKVQLTEYFDTVASKKQFEIISAMSAINLRAVQIQKMLSAIQAADLTTLNNANITQSIYYNQPITYNSDLLNVLQKLIQIGNRTFPY